VPVLILVASAYLFFFVVIALIAIAEIADRRERKRQRLTYEHMPLVGMSVTQAFDPVYASLWEAQIPALERIGRARAYGLSLRKLTRSFRCVCSRFPEIFDGCGLEQWILFLQQEELVAWNAGRVRITNKGTEFLRFRFTSNVTLAGKE
jgi:hypothetical protein